MIGGILTIEFNHSKSPRFRFALEEAKKNSSFKEQSNIFLVSFEEKDFEGLHRMVELLKGFIHKRIFVDEKEEPWDKVFRYYWCYRLRQRAYDPKQYCHGDSRQFPALNPWGCIHANMPLGIDVEWLRYGSLDSDGKTFIFDKKKIAHYLKVNTEEYRFCPAMDTKKMLTFLEAFPESVNPMIDPEWKYIGSLNKFSGLTATISLEDYGPDSHIDICGVCPASLEAVHSINEKIQIKLKNQI